MDPEEGGGGLMGSRILGLPAIVWVLIAVGAAYWWYSRSSGGAGGSSSAGSSDTLTTGNTTIDTGAVQVSVNASNGGSGPAPGKATTVTVPQVTGDTAARARRELSRHGLKASGITGGNVATETPKAGSKVKKGSTVNLAGKGKNQ